MSHVIPIFDEKNGFIGIWADDEDFTPTFGNLAELVALTEPTLKALTKSAVTRTLNRGRFKVGNVTFENGVFVMWGGEKSPQEEVKAGKSFRAFSYHGIPCAQRVDTPLDGYSPETKHAVPFDPGKWFNDASNRSGPHSPSDFNLLKVPRSPIAEWAAGVSQRPNEVMCTEVRIRELSNVTGILFDEIKKRHGLDSRAAVKLFDEYLAAACPECFHGINGNGLQMAAAGSQMAAVLGGGSDFQRLLSGKCPNCESEVFYCVWNGDRKTPVTELAPPIGRNLPISGAAKPPIKRPALISFWTKLFGKKDAQEKGSSQPSAVVQQSPSKDEATDEQRRRAIYREHEKLTRSFIGKYAMMGLPQQTAIERALEEAANQVERTYGVTFEQFMSIYKEGNAQKW